MAVEASKATDHDALEICDLVMKGGITSGVVYPPAVLVLKQKYRFRSIGGTSAGAIAAAATAAAEYNREGDGFEQLKMASDSLAENNLLLNLFQAPAQTRLLLETLLALLPKGKSSNSSTTAAESKHGTGRMKQQKREQGLFQSVVQRIDELAPIWKQYSPTYKKGQLIGMGAGAAAGIGVAAALSAIVLAPSYLIDPASVNKRRKLWPPLRTLGAISGVLGGWLGSRVGGRVAGVNDLVQIVTREVPANYYGICIGHSSEDKNVLTDWLSASIDKIAGLKEQQKPLTFGQLSSKQVDGKKVGITLKVVTSNLSHGEPYTLPYGLEGFLFNKDEMRQFFPEYVVQHMIAYSIKNKPMGQTTIAQEKLPPNYYFLPTGDDLPVVVATRLSLSFPILISAVPFYTIRSSALEMLAKGTLSRLRPTDLQQNWFSDGGICSNFPIHFYDAWLPRFPTFGINLASVPSESLHNDHQDAKQLNMGTFSALDTRNVSRAPAAAPVDVYLPQAESLLDPEWSEFDNPLAFLQAIFSTAQNYRDSMQSRLPSYRERVVQIRLNKDEGGLNLSMPRETMQTVVQKGMQAGAILSEKFNFEHHWWIRFLVLMAQLETNFTAMQEVLEDPVFQERLNNEVSLLSDFPYRRDEDWIKEAKRRLKELEDMMVRWQNANKQWIDPPLFGKDPPQPQTVLRVTPGL